MSKPVKSQWNFGELFPAETIRKVLTVGELTQQVKRLLEKQVGQVWVTGEITNLRIQSSGHVYFTLKDADSQLKCVLFRTEATGVRDLLQDGRKLIVRGDVTVYESYGQYQLRVVEVELQGIGALQAAFEKLKQKLNAEGLFATERKRALPHYPRRIGIVTSPTGAAIRDVLHVVQRRNPSLQIVLAACRVQGQGAAEEIADAIRLLNEFHEHESESNGGLDLILVTRGGGSLEDLWAFNEEVVARAIFESRLPVVSAVGHEIDFTISDFVADFRAATPSAAAEIITEGVFSSLQFLFVVSDRMRQLVHQAFVDKMDGWEQVQQRLVRLNPQRRIENEAQRLDDLNDRLLRCSRHGIRIQQTGWRHLYERLGRLRPAQTLAQHLELLNVEKQRLHEVARHRYAAKQSQFATLQKQLRLLGPEQVLARGYSVTMREDDGKIVRSAAGLKDGEALRTRLKDGEVRSVIKKDKH